MSDDPNKPDHPSPAWRRQQAAARICRDCFDGPLRIRSEKTRYLPRFPAESNEAYEERLATSVFYDAFGRTIHGLTGMVFRQPPKLADDLPAELGRFWENVDLQGTHGDVFVQRRHEDGEVDGHFVILVDMPPADPETERTLAEERAAGRRPYWVGIRKQDVLAADHDVEGGRLVLTHFRYRETVTVPEGRYGHREVLRVREYNRTQGEGGSVVTFQVHERAKDETGKEAWVSSPVRTMDGMDEIPVVVGYHGERVGPFESRPPHLALALENVKHYQLVSDNDNVLHLCSVPIFIRIGYEEREGTQTVAANAGVDLPLEGDAKYVEPEGHGLEAAERRIAKSEHRMAILGLSMLMSESRAAETATSKRIDKAESDSALSDHARATQDAIEEALRLTAKWMGLDLPEKRDGRWVELNRDFEHLPLDAQMVSALAELVASGNLSQESLWATMVRGGVLPDTFDPEQERDRIGADGVELVRALAQGAREPGGREERTPPVGNAA